jgi:hypothetical protein
LAALRVVSKARHSVVKMVEMKAASTAVKMVDLMDRNSENLSAALKAYPWGT